ncbi:UV radiation resistance protein and autophagy-related subunit 14-domain-containing protein [Gaertneriomyces semiglobifer]|nr:UV radiation resistance protein and autophagy-related subunit 14-domain-containing protein [Gaertneriomyces semiglobifer]
MECGACGSARKRFWCTRCITNKLSTAHDIQHSLTVEKDLVAEEINSILGDHRPQTGISTVIQAATLRERIRVLKEKSTSTRRWIDEGKKELEHLQATLSLRHASIYSATQSMTASNTSVYQSLVTDTQATHQQHMQTLALLSRARILVIRAVASIFRLRTIPRRAPRPIMIAGGARIADSVMFGRQNTSQGSISASTPNIMTARDREGEAPLECRIANVGFPLFGYYMNYPKEKFNAALGHIVHMTILFSHYLDVQLPFRVCLRGNKSYAEAHYLDSGPDGNREMPLYLTDSNTEVFVYALAMLNYDIAYLCWTVGVDVQLHKVVNTLENLLKCCQTTAIPESSPRQGRLFPLDFQKVLRLHKALRRKRFGAQGQGLLAINATGKDPLSQLVRRMQEENSEEDEEVNEEWLVVDEIGVPLDM